MMFYQMDYALALWFLSFCISILPNDIPRDWASVSSNSDLFSFLPEQTLGGRRSDRLCMHNIENPTLRCDLYDEQMPRSTWKSNDLRYSYLQWHFRAGYTNSEQAHCPKCVEFRCIVVTPGNYVEQQNVGLWDGLELWTEHKLGNNHGFGNHHNFLRHDARIRISRWRPRTESVPVGYIHNPAKMYPP